MIHFYPKVAMTWLPRSLHFSWQVLLNCLRNSQAFLQLMTTIEPNFPMQNMKKRLGKHGIMALWCGACIMPLVWRKPNMVHAGEGQKDVSLVVKSCRLKSGLIVIQSSGWRRSSPSGNIRRLWPSSKTLESSFHTKYMKTTLKIQHFFSMSIFKKFHS